MEQVSEMDMATIECRALDNLRNIAHTAFIHFKANRDGNGLGCLYALREAFRILEFSMSPEEVSVIVSLMEDIEPQLQGIARNYKNRVSIRFLAKGDANTTKNVNPSEILDSLFSKFYFYRQRAGLGVKTKQVEGL